jgi:hypothetical protein
MPAEQTRTTQRRKPVSGAATLTDPQRAAIKLLVEGILSHRRIALHPDVDVHRATISNWIAWPPFQKALAEAGKEYERNRTASAMRALYRIQERRYLRLLAIVDALQELGVEYDRIRDQTATTDPEIGLSITMERGEYMPGAETGLLARRIKRVTVDEGRDDEGRKVRSEREEVEWIWQVGLLKELRELEKTILDEEERMGKSLHDARMRLAELADQKASTTLKELQAEAIRSAGASPGGAAPISLVGIRIVEARRPEEDLPEGDSSE